MVHMKPESTAQTQCLLRYTGEWGGSGALCKGPRVGTDSSPEPFRHSKDSESRVLIYKTAGEVSHQGKVLADKSSDGLGLIPGSH